VRLRSKAEAARPATLDEILTLICEEEPALLERYGSLDAARDRFRVLQARGELPVGQRTQVPYLALVKMRP
jgi:hypothetical protein